MLWTAEKVSQDDLGITVIPLEDHPQKQSFVQFITDKDYNLDMFESVTRKGLYIKRFPEGVLIMSDRVRYIPRGEQDWVHGHITEVFIRTRPCTDGTCDTEYAGIYSLVVTDENGFEADLRPEDVEIFADDVKFPLVAGESITVYRNQALREGEVLLTYEDMALISYEMPNGRVFTNAVNLHNKDQYLSSIPKRVQRFYEQIYSF